MARSFKAFGKQLSRAVDSALSQSAHDLAGDVRSRARRGETGELADSVESEKLGPCRYRVAIGSDHAAAVEYGNAHQAAEPFARPAFDSRKGKIESAVARAIKNA